MSSDKRMTGSVLVIFILGRSKRPFKKLMGLAHNVAIGVQRAGQLSVGPFSNKAPPL